MIVKPLMESNKMKKLEVILQRISPLHPNCKGIEEELARSRAGYRVEKSLQYHLELLPSEDTFILHDLRLPFGKQFFQIDVLILRPNFFLLLEVKNMAGTLIFDHQFNQLIRINNIIEEIFPSPLSQIYRQQFLFSEWLKLQKYSDSLIESLVVISNPLTRIQATPENHALSHLVIHSNNFLSKFHSLNKTHQEQKFTSKELKKLSKLLLKHHTFTDTNLFKQFNLSEKDIVKGVICPNCSKLPMVRKKSKWHCDSCNLYSKDAHIQALKDYTLLFGQSMTNKQCRDFLQITSRNVAQYILGSHSFPTTGAKKGRKYYLIFDDQ
ncbi:nuclease-related domain-containing protein [Fictibacillus barbaricus]|uniref:NERD domain-containing protein n=1 Tax=Fictibacillus barbaricus TaxID=182136 RepID=A0ABS2ZFD0_9BACL|nr:nuclease-related domain-containing protein [Fictibacillus barbaricus]MBN3546660.1 NERD domain-containing protein [Fictibacillus barbaricus]